MKKFLLTVAIALSATTASQAAEQTEIPPSASTLTRTQVLHELEAWRTAGLAEESRGEQTPDIHSNAYRAKVVAYQELLAGERLATK